MTALILKLLAMATMVVDHVGIIFLDDLLVCRLIGRIAFPLYAFMTVDSCRHVAKREDGLKRYLISLGILAVISEPFYDYAFEHVWVDLSEQNQILQFFTFALTYAVTLKLRKPVWKVLVWIATLALNYIFHIGFWSAGITLMLLFLWYLNQYEDQPAAWRWGANICIMALFFVALCIDDTTSEVGFTQFGPVLLNNIGRVLKYRGLLLAVPFLALYTGKYGRPSKWFKTIYRYFYPAHLALFSIVEMLM